MVCGNYSHSTTSTLAAAHGTELVSLSACDTGKGVIDYSEGVYGLIRASRTAGTRNVLMILQPVREDYARNFMAIFYDHWLGSPDKIGPAEAIHRTRLYYLVDSEKISF